ncbi:MAG: GNAT family N-acetyltransferase [Bacteriovorax sp.]|nr:GNAT family N-acetyltransferase [Bacteriovorax sp.]
MEEIFLFVQLVVKMLLLQALIDWTKSTNKIEKINLRVHSDNDTGIGLYKKLGSEIEVV